MGMSMGGGRKSGRGRRGVPRYGAMADINMTPFIDVMLVLLIIFMVAAPLLTSGVAVDLPQAKAGALNVEQKPIAIALDYKREGGRVDPNKGPRVAATGKGAVAEQILQIAFERGIPVREDPDLAQILSTLEVDSVIPVDALAAVAEILSYLYRLNGKVLDGRSGTEDGDAVPAESEGAPR